jgi:MSHA biogenesis protein MshQ
LAGAASERITSARAIAASSVKGGVKVVSRRLQVINNYGSELLTVPVSVQLQYWDGIRFLNSTTDQKTSFTRQDLTRRKGKKGLIAVGRQASGLNYQAQLTVAASPAWFAVANGASGFRLATRGAQNTGSIDLNIDAVASPWLPSNSARIGVGIDKAGPVIYLRKMY